jgi:hypothetical protein
MTTVFGDVWVELTSGEYGGLSAFDPNDRTWKGLEAIAEMIFLM